MLGVGLLLFALAALFTGGIVFSDSSNIDVTAYGVTISALPLGVLFLAGLLTGLIGLLGLGLMSRGAARRRALRRESRDADKEKTHLKTMNERLAADLQRERARGAVAPEPYPGVTTETARPAASPRHRH